MVQKKKQKKNFKIVEFLFLITGLIGFQFPHVYLLIFVNL